MATCFWSSSSRGLQICCILFFLCSSLFFLPLSESVNFEFTVFRAGETGILYSGDAKASDGAIEFNEVSIPNRVGHAIYEDAVQIWDSKSDKLTDFTTHFTFIIKTPKDPGHGLAFFLAPVGFQIPPNSGGPYLGLFNTSYNKLSQNKIIYVEFDSKNHSWDPPFPHVGINTNWLESDNSTAWNASLHSGDPADVWVSYNANTQMLNLSWRYRSDNTSGENTSLLYRVDLRKVLPEWVTIGFSAATGTSTERHTLQYWKFNSSLNNIVHKIEDTSKKRKLVVGLTVPLGVVAVGVIITWALFWRKEDKPSQNSLETVALTSTNDDLERGAGPKRFSYENLMLATNNFSADQKLGEGGFGCVYKGYLSRERMQVAVKKISQGSKQGKKEYLAEVKIISRLIHRNLVQLVGWYHDQTQFCLVYEFLSNGSLDSHLFYKKSILEWGVRYKIATGVASALFYLHEECEHCVVHRDVKTSNIMLDSGFNVKLGDFGLARLMDPEQGIKTTALAGTLGYMCPEYLTTGKASKESDIYSFGVVALEIVCGRKATDRVDPHLDLGLVKWVWGLYEKGKLLYGVDQILNNEFDVTQVECLMKVGLWCAHPEQNMRPSIRQAIHVLMFDGAIPQLPLRMPIPMYNTTTDPLEVGSSGATMANSSS
ncbi:L-type lectin-domain containing receptor kinase IX.1 [Lactuca sativa]|uniref:Protein kinase domain-containing protein n=1 Tax=Lactuca sativa TaxID=4236 RepID=A0A9R1V975_LACSA|nr:L-type lectin-domain containing receptor kinase IX.1 [Lactuca sativa]KAJ0200516.1 hypothetical protein LSAT_V11C600327180 [Lactuca sativa]